MKITVVTSMLLLSKLHAWLFFNLLFLQFPNLKSHFYDGFFNLNLNKSPINMFTKEFLH